jgi:Tfp pilus assembly protein PilW
MSADRWISRPEESVFPPRRGFRRRRAFTLVELLVAAGITALIAGFIAVIVRNVAITWTRSGNRLGTDAQARLVLDQLQLDLQGAMFRDDGNVWLAAEIVDRTGLQGGPWQEAARNPKPTGAGANGSVLLNTVNIADARFGKAGVWLRFFTTSRNTNASTATASAPVAVGYQISRRFVATNPANQNTAYLLHRVQTRPAATGAGAAARIGVLEAGYNIVSANYTTSATAANNGSQPDDPRAIQVISTNLRSLDSVVADNVVDFGIRAYVRDAASPGGLRLVFPANATGQPAGNANSRYRPTLPSGTPPDATNFSTIFPDVVDVMIRILTDDGATQLANIERVQTPALTVPQKYNGNAQAWWWGIVQENSRVYTRRIVLNAKSL